MGFLAKLLRPRPTIRVIEHAYTAQCFVTADLDNNQINAFHPGAMQFSHENSVAEHGPLRVAIIAPDNGPSIRVAERTGFASRENALYKGEPILLFRRLRPALA